MISENEFKFLIWALITLLGILAWIGSLGVKHLAKISNSVNKMEKDLGILTNDHSNLKDDVKKVETRMATIEQKIMLNGKHI